jgi:hypothetical protein
MNNLPVVKSQICFSVEQSLYEKSDKDYLKEQIQKIEKNNPIVAEFIRRYAKTTIEPINVMFGLVMVYNLLESQAEADALNELFE